MSAQYLALAQLQPKGSSLDIDRLITRKSFNFKLAAVMSSTNFCGPYVLETSVFWSWRMCAELLQHADHPPMGCSCFMYHVYFRWIWFSTVCCWLFVLPWKWSIQMHLICIRCMPCIHVNTYSIYSCACIFEKIYTLPSATLIWVLRTPCWRLVRNQCQNCSWTTEWGSMGVSRVSLLWFHFPGESSQMFKY